jgi:hypothetical protein
MMLRPRDDNDQKVLESELEITPEPSHLSWSQDTFGNHVATARFSRRASELRFESTIRLDHAPAGFGEADIEDFARTYPFAYRAEERAGLARFVAPLSQRRFATSVTMSLQTVRPARLTRRRMSRGVIDGARQSKRRKTRRRRRRISRCARRYASRRCRRVRR